MLAMPQTNMFLSCVFPMAKPFIGLDLMYPFAQDSIHNTTSSNLLALYSIYWRLTFLI